MKNSLIAVLSIFSFLSVAAAEKPVIKIDFNESSRNQMEEVLEPGYTPLACRGHVKNTLTVKGVTFIVSSKNSSTIGTGWNKAFIQSKTNNARLLGDGLMLASNSTGTIELTISNLPEGSHTLQTFHNGWRDPSMVAGYPMSVYLNDALVYQKVERTYRVNEVAEATVLVFDLEVKSKSDVVRIDFVTNDKIKPGIQASEYDYSPVLNALELNTSPIKKIAKRPVPADVDLHVDADNGMLQMSWSPANREVVKHYLYLGTDPIEVASADTTDNVFVGAKWYGDTTYILKNVYSLNTYYWRVDELNKNGEVITGKLWCFRPRHLAFRGAEGYGRFATGGRGGKVVHVTNLNDSGAGSFREAVTKEIGPRTIVFDVSGMITLESRLVCREYITIAGQTAPGKGICIRSAPVGIGRENICRFIRVRLGSGVTADGMGMTGGNHGIVDHCSISWTIDEGFSSRGGKNITLQRTLISEALSIAGHKNYEEGFDHGYAGSISGDVGSFHHNLLAHNSGRNWSLAGGLDGDGNFAGRLDIFNNVVYNWCKHACYNGAKEVNYVNNYYKPGPATLNHDGILVMLDADSPEEAYSHSTTSTQRYYFAGNVMENIFDEQSQEKGRRPNFAEEKKYDAQYYKQWVDKPFFPSFATIEKAGDSYKSVLSDVGCTMPMIDEHDQRIYREVLTGTYTYRGSVSGREGIIDDESDAGGYEDYGSEVRPADFDSDMDGLPNWWEELYGSNPNSAAGDFSDSNADPDHDGYTALEDYLEWMSVPHFYVTKNQSKKFDLADYAISYTNGPRYKESMLTSEDLTLKLDGSKVTVTPQKNYTGISYFDFTVTDKEGSSMTRRIGIYVGNSSVEK